VNNTGTVGNAGTTDPSPISLSGASTFNNNAGGVAYGPVQVGNGSGATSTFNNAVNATINGNVTVDDSGVNSPSYQYNLDNAGHITGNVTGNGSAAINNSGAIDGTATVNGGFFDNSGAVTGQTTVNAGDFNNLTNGNVGNAVITGTGTLTNDGAINGWTSIASNGTLINNVDGALGATVAVGNLGSTDQSTFVNHGDNPDTVVTVNGGSNTGIANTNTFVNFDNDGTTGDVTGNDYSYSINEVNGTVGDVDLYDYAKFDNYGNAGDAVAYDNSLFTNEAGGHADSITSQGGIVINDGTVDNVYDFGGTQYNSGIVGNVVVAKNTVTGNSGYYFNNSQDGTKTGTVTGTVTVGTSGDTTDYSAFFNTVAGDTV
jgi:hypothetical protein